MTDVCNNFVPYVIHFQQAEEMHQKAIKIKEELLGLEDYEVALSVGHLASLYNYDMKKYTEAETLYQRSIDISKWYKVTPYLSEQVMNGSRFCKDIPLVYRSVLSYFASNIWCKQHPFLLMSMKFNELQKYQIIITIEK